MNLNHIIIWIIHTVQQHEKWTIPIIFFLSFCESLAFFSLLIPATIFLLAIGALIGKNGLSFWPIWATATTGAFIGDWISYMMGYYYQYRVIRMWPLSRNPHILVRGHAFFEKWGVFSIFFGRFFGPLRAVVSLVGGICAMPLGAFQIANITSAMIWAFSILAPGVFGIKWFSQWLG